MDNPGMSALLSERIPQVKGLRCVICERLYSLDEVQYVCPSCGQVGTLDIELDPTVIPMGRDNPNQPAANVWEDARFLPLAQDMPSPLETIPLQIGNTPYYPAGAKRKFSLIDDGKNPTGSFKDRASALVVHHAMTIGAKVVATASTGNAAAALAGVCAAAGDTQAVIFVPASAPLAKITQLLVYGAKVLLIDASYDVAFDLCWEACEAFGWYNRSTGINPFTSEGKKTIAWDIVFSGYDLPDTILVPVGDGSIISSVYKGFSDLRRLGWVDRIPRLVGVQSTGSMALVQAWRDELDPREMTPQRAETVADSIAAALPRDRAKALRAVRNTNGAFVAVTDAEIINAIPALARATGIFAEPASAAVYVGWSEAIKRGYVDPDERVLFLNTGNGLKDVQRAMQAVAPFTPHAIPPNLDAIKDAVKALGL